MNAPVTQPERHRCFVVLRWISGWDPKNNKRKRLPTITTTTTTTTTMVEFLSIESLLTKYAKNIKAGEIVTFNLIKGGTTSSHDPLDPKAPTVDFPIVAKFGYDHPNLGAAPHRMYEQKVPMALDDSDDEPEAKREVEESWTSRKKKRRRNRPDRRQWILQPETEFMESLGIRNKKPLTSVTATTDPTAATNNNDTTNGKGSLKSRYEGVGEANSSSYFLFEVHPTTQQQMSSNSSHGSNNTQQQQLHISATPVQSFQIFHQPSKVHTLSMQEAEDMIGDQRAQITRFMMHAKAAAAGQTTTATATSTGGRLLRGGARPIPLSRARLFGKLLTGKGAGKGAGDEDEDDDDVMTDLKFSNRKKGGRARQELLQSLGEGLAVDDDGVLGGQNDSEFAGKRNFGRISQHSSNNGTAATAPTGKSTTSDGMAMSDDFYQRDVQAEYEDLDFDASQQFDDDEVDQTEEMDVSGIVGDDEEEDSDSDADDEEGVSGLATVAGLKALMARARGETTISVEEAAAAAAAAAAANILGKRAAAGDGAGNVTSDQSSDDDLPQSKRPRVGGQQQQQLAAAAVLPKAVDPLAVDETGQRIISLEAIRREIWLHHGQIKTKTLVKIFNVKKRSVEHKKIFGDLVKELCTMTQTVEGNALVLKQHYAK